LVIGAVIFREASFLQAAGAFLFGPEIRVFSPLPPSLNICNSSTNSHAAHAVGDSRRLQPPSMLRRRGDDCWRLKMKKTLVTAITLGTALMAFAAPAFAAPPKHRAPVVNDTGPYGPLPQERLMAPRSSVVSTEGRVVGADPDPNIRTQLLHDPDPTGF
jgi:hypothetical protein